MADSGGTYRHVSMSRMTSVVSAIGAGFFLIPGAWAFFAPRSFFDKLAPWPPYNEHFIHDIGSFQIGLGVALLVTLFARRGLVAGLAGAATAALVHVVSHVLDYGDGGRTTDPYGLGLLAVALLAATVLEWRRAR